MSDNELKSLLKERLDLREKELSRRRALLVDVLNRKLSSSEQPSGSSASPEASSGEQPPSAKRVPELNEEAFEELAKKKHSGISGGSDFM